MKLFTVEEANDLLPVVRPKLERMREQYGCINVYRDEAKAAATSSDSGGGMTSGSVYVRCLYEIGKLTTEFHELGIQLKDYSRGLIDFPSLRGGEVILLCWQLGEDEQIEWWHEVEAGFAGRQRL